MNIFGLNIGLAKTTNGTIQIDDKGRQVFDFLSADKSYNVDCSTIQGRSKAYKECDVIRTVIGKSSNAIANLKFWALDDNEQEVKTRQAKAIIEKLKRPNPSEDFKRFFRKLDLYCKLHGKAYVHKVYSELFDEWNYYVIPNEFVTTLYGTTTDALFNRVVDKYIINDNTSSYELSPNDIHIFYDGTLNEQATTETVGGSRLESLSEVVSTYIVEWQCLTEMYGDRGALNIISMGAKDASMLSLPQLASEKNKLNEMMSARYGLRRKQSKSIFTSTDAKVSPITAKMSDMEFGNTIIECKKAIANAFDCPAVLLDIESARYKNTTEAIKVLYTQSAIPTAEYYFSEWCQMIGELSLPFKIRADYSHLEFYQEAKKEEAIAFQQMSNAIATLGSVVIDAETGVITKEEARQKLNLI